jgi:hypothetical protein
MQLFKVIGFDRTHKGITKSKMIFITKPSEESEGCVIETKTNDCPSCDGKKFYPYS